MYENDYPLALRLFATLRVWTVSEPRGNGKAAQGGVDQFPNIERIKLDTLGGRTVQLDPCLEPVAHKRRRYKK